jgi:hypothetical protein
MGHSRGGEAAATAALFNKLAYYPDDATMDFRSGPLSRSPPPMVSTNRPGSGATLTTSVI